MAQGMSSSSTINQINTMMIHEVLTQSQAKKQKQKQKQYEAYLRYKLISNTVNIVLVYVTYLQILCFGGCFSNYT